MHSEAKVAPAVNLKSVPGNRKPKAATTADAEVESRAGEMDHVTMYFRVCELPYQFKIIYFY